MTERAEAGQFKAATATRLIRSLWGVAATMLSLAYTVVLAPVAWILAVAGRYRAVSAISRFWARMIIRTCGVKVEIEGLENLPSSRSYVLVANHQSLFDIFAIIAYMPGDARFVAKKELLRIPLIGYTMKATGHIVVERQSGGRAIRHALEAARDNYPICVFAEGHRFNDGRVHEFNEGAAWLAITARLPCVPMAISGSGAIFAPGAIIVVPGGRMRIKICRPIQADETEKPDRRELTRRLEQSVREAFVPSL